MKITLNFRLAMTSMSILLFFLSNPGVTAAQGDPEYTPPLTWEELDPPPGEEVAPGLVGYPLVASPGEPSDPVMMDGGLHRGGWNGSFELALPPGPAGTKPQIRLVAEHNARLGLVGRGHILQFGSRITRHNKDGGAPNLTIASSFKVDGTPLIEENGKYYPEHWNGSVFNQVGDTWQRAENGWVHTYGAANGDGMELLFLEGGRSGELVSSPTHDDGNAHFDTCTRGSTEPCNIIGWNITSSTDPFGHTIHYFYETPDLPEQLPLDVDFMGNSRQVRPRLITYGNAQIELEYEPRADIQLTISSGTPVIVTDRLASITTRINSQHYSRYEFRYTDTDLTNCDGDVVAVPSVPETALRRLVETGSAGYPSRELRCFEYNDEAIGFEASTDVTSSFTNPNGSGGWDNSSDFVRPFPQNLNGDGISDLIVVSGSCTPGCSINIDAAMGTNTGQFNPPNSVANEWISHLSIRLDSTYIELDRPYTFVDLDNDGWSEFLYEESGLTVLRYDPATNSFAQATLPTFSHDLAELEFADVDGDGFQDAINKRERAWFRNPGKDPWFENQPELLFARPMLPAATAPYNIMDAWEYSTSDFVADQFRLGDFNGDGCVDLAGALFKRWVDRSDCTESNRDNCRYVPDPTTLYSKTLYGDCYGYFIDSGSSAGAPFLMELQRDQTTDRNRIWNGFFSTVDFNRSGFPELVQSSVAGPGTMEARAAPYQGLELGFQLQTEAQAVEIYDEHGTELSESPLVFDIEVPTEDLGISGTGPGDSCYPHSRLPVIADFNGDGFSDILTFEGEPSGNTTCNTDFCVGLRLSDRQTSQRRLTEVQNEFGGRTELKWGFSAARKHNNPDLYINIEVLKAVDGSDGLKTIRYERGTMSHGEFAGFGAASVKNARGGLDVIGFNLVPALRGKPLFKARYRMTGELERATAFVHGEIQSRNGGADHHLLVDNDRPFFNPAIRQCDYEEKDPANYSLQSLIWHCFYHERGAGIVAIEQLMAMSGWWRYPDFSEDPSGHTPYDIATHLWHETPAPLASVELGNLATPLPQILDFAATQQSPEYKPVDLRWSAPEELTDGGSVSLEDHYFASIPADVYSTETVAHVVDWEFNPVTKRRASRMEHRDITTDDDDRKTDFVWEEYPAGSEQYRLNRMTHFAGATLDLVSNYYVPVFSSYGFANPADIDRCGHQMVNGFPVASCFSEHYTYDADGRPLTYTNAEGGVTTYSYSQDWCHGDITTTDPENRQHIETFDLKCLKTRDEKEFRVRTFDYDAFRRQSSSTDSADNGATVETTTFYYDDHRSYDATLDTREDIDFDEPFMAAESSNGSLVLMHLDGFGRPTLMKQCVAAPGSGQGVFADVECAPNSGVRAEWTGYGTDGTPIASAPTYEPGVDEDVSVTRLIRDGAGRPVVTRHPAPSNILHWVSKKLYMAPSRRIYVGPEGDSRTTKWSTLTKASFVPSLSGTLQGRQRMDALGRVVGAEDADGKRIRYHYDSRGRNIGSTRVENSECATATSTTLAPCTYSTTFAYDQMNRIIRKDHPDGTYQVFDYDDVGRPTLIEHHSGQGDSVVLASMQYLTDGYGRPETVIHDELGGTVRTSFDGLGRPVESSTPYGTDVIQYLGVGNGEYETVVTRNSGSWSRTRSRVTGLFGEVVSSTDWFGATTTYDYNSAGLLAATKDDDNAERLFFYNPAGLLSSTEGGGYTLSQVTYDGEERVMTSVDAMGVITSRRYDALGRLEHLNFSEQLEVDFLFDGNSSRITESTVTVTDLQATTFGQTATVATEFDPWGRKSFGYLPDGDVEHELIYDVMGRIRQIVDAEGYAMETVYDYRGRPVYTDLAGPNYQKLTYSVELTWAYPSDGTAVTNIRVIESKDALGRQTVARSDHLGRPIAVTRPDGTVVEYRYDGMRLDQVLLVDGNTVIGQTDYTYDDQGDGRLEKVEGPFDPTGIATAPYIVSYEYSQAGRVTEIDAAGESTYFQYLDGFLTHERTAAMEKELLRSIQGSGLPRVEGYIERKKNLLGTNRTTVLHFDGLGRVTQSTAADGTSLLTETFEDFDAFGHPLKTNRTTDGYGIVDEVETLFTYTPNGRPETRELFINGTSYGTTSWEWFQNGIQQAVTSPSGIRLDYDYGTTFDYTLDEIRRGGVDVLARYVSRDRAGQPTAIERPEEGTQISLAYDTLGRVVTHGVYPMGSAGAPPTRSWERGYSSLGLLDWEDETINGNTWRNSFSYDNLGRLVSETDGATGTLRQYVLDAPGRRLTTSVTTSAGTTTQALTYQEDVLYSVDSAIIKRDAWQGTTADQFGNTYDRDADGEVRFFTAAGEQSRIVRDAAGMPVATIEPSGQYTTHWGLDPASYPLEVEDPSLEHVHYAVAPGLLYKTSTDSAGVIAPRGSGQLDTDALGRVRTFNTHQVGSGSSFGADSPQGTERYNFGILDRLPGSDDIYFARHRAVDATTGQFLRPDPIGLRGGLHRTLYAEANPVSYNDPMGWNSQCADPGNLGGRAMLGNIQASQIYAATKLAADGGAYTDPELLGRADIPMGNIFAGVSGSAGASSAPPSCLYDGCGAPGEASSSYMVELAPPEPAPASDSIADQLRKWAGPLKGKADKAEKKAERKQNKAQRKWHRKTKNLKETINLDDFERLPEAWKKYYEPAGEDDLGGWTKMVLKKGPGGADVSAADDTRAGADGGGNDSSNGGGSTHTVDVHPHDTTTPRNQGPAHTAEGYAITGAAPPPASAAVRASAPGSGLGIGAPPSLTPPIPIRNFTPPNRPNTQTSDTTGTGETPSSADVFFAGATAAGAVARDAATETLEAIEVLASGQVSAGELVKAVVIGAVTEGPEAAHDWAVKGANLTYRLLSDPTEAYTAFVEGDVATAEELATQGTEFIFAGAKFASWLYAFGLARPDLPDVHDLPVQSIRDDVFTILFDLPSYRFLSAREIIEAAYEIMDVLRHLSGVQPSDLHYLFPDHRVQPMHANYRGWWSIDLVPNDPEALGALRLLVRPADGGGWQVMIRQTHN